MMEILVGIDDTDNLESKGTGHLAEILRHDIEILYGGSTSRITRHQLFVSDEIPYTSHNSAMCFKGEIEDFRLDDLISHAGGFLEKMSAEGSDPGLCIAVTERIAEREKLVSFGCDATSKVVTKENAIELANITGVHLSEHGGTGGGIIGALAGVGLRLGGNNGRFKGWLSVKESDRRITVERLLKDYEIDEVRDICGEIPGSDDSVSLDEKIKTVLLDGRCVLPVKKNMAGNSIWINLSRDEIRRY